MSNPNRHHKPPFLRLLGYVKPYVALFGVVLLLTVVYSGAHALRNYLLKPLFDEVIMAEQANLPSTSSMLSSLGFGDAEEPAPQETEPSAEEKFKNAADRAAEAEFRATLFGICGWALFIVLVAPPTLFVKDYLVEYILGRVRVDVQQDLCLKLLALPLSFHEGTTRGDLLSRTTNDVSHAHLTLRLLFGDLLNAVVRIVLFVGIMVAISWQLSLLVVIIAPAVILVVSRFGRKIRKSAKRRQEKVSDLTQRLTEILSGIKVIQAFQGEERESVSFGNENRLLFKREMKVRKNRILSRSIVEMMTQSIALLIIMVGALIVRDGLWGLTMGSLLFFFATLQGTNRPIKTVTKGWNQLMDALPAAERFFELMDTPSMTPDTEGAHKMRGVNESITFENVSFSYGREPVLTGIDLRVEPGEIVAFVGKTGSGKTTLIDLLMRFYDPDEGAIKIDGTDLREIQRTSLLDHMAVVTQDAFLFQGTIAENIRYARADASDDDVLAAARAAHVDEFASSLGKGYDTDVGEFGVQLSGGQRQRITIARALLKNPDLLIFDEATSALDTESERYVQDAIDRLLGERTVFVIAHRLSTIRHADKIVVLEDGVISHIGTHEELLEQEGLYQKLMNLQDSNGSKTATT
ncbi:MAG: ABC transporter ATP-binding protein [Deltaproteobacteria bacterium]|nr:ABC transporter ATP-binding protein [Deltaproteobacteria bacterium]